MLKSKGTPWDSLPHAYRCAWGRGAEIGAEAVVVGHLGPLLCHIAGDMLSDVLCNVPGKIVKCIFL